MTIDSSTIMGWLIKSFSDDFAAFELLFAYIVHTVRVIYLKSISYPFVKILFYLVGSSISSFKD